MFGWSEARQRKPIDDGTQPTIGVVVVVIIVITVIVLAATATVATFTEAAIGKVSNADAGTGTVTMVRRPGLEHDRHHHKHDKGLLAEGYY